MWYIDCWRQSEGNGKEMEAIKLFKMNKLTDSWAENCLSNTDDFMLFYYWKKLCFYWFMDHKNEK